MKIFNNKGLSIVECLTALVLTSVAVIGLMAVQPLGLLSAGKADSISHATQIMQTELESVESRIMTGNFATVSDFTKTNLQVTVNTMNTEPYFLSTTVTEPATNRWLVRVRVTWTGNATGIRSSIIVTRQSVFS